MNCVITKANGHAGVSHPVERTSGILRLSRTIDFSTVPEPYHNVGSIQINIRLDDVLDLISEALCEDSLYPRKARRTATKVRRTLRDTIAYIDELNS